MTAVPTTETPFLDRLRDVLPGDAVVTDPAALAEASHDWSDGPAVGRPVALVRPAGTDGVAAVARLATEHRVPLIPQGARTGLAGAANASDGAVLVSTARLDRILRIDTENQLVVTQPGVNTARLAAAVAARGLFYPPDPASIELSTIGGNVATNAGGMRCVKYGVTSDFVRALEVVLADGRVIRSGHATVKGVAGLDLTHLFVGSEGTLGVVTEITLALLPAPGATVAASATFARRADALDAAHDIMASPHRPSTLEFMDEATIAATNAYDPGAGLPAGARALLIVQSDAADRAAEDVELYAGMLRAHDALTVDVATDPAELDRLMHARRLLNRAMHAVRGESLNEDVAVPRSRLGDVLAGVDALSEELDLPMGTAGHVGDGNLHPVVCYDPADPDQVRRAHIAYGRILRLAVRLGGTVTGEHGVGLMKRDALDDELGPDLRTLQRAVKRTLDPLGLLNPGKKL